VRINKSYNISVAIAYIFMLLVFSCKVTAYNDSIDVSYAESSAAYLVTKKHTKKETKAKKQIAIIIDDIGAKSSDAKAFALSRNITFSILPHTNYSTEFSYRAARQNREVMLHMPMESLNKENLGPGPLLANMYPKEVKSALLNALKTVPHAVGVNNHMGSKLTQMTLQMTTFMSELEANNLFFVDSRTTRFTKASFIAKQQGVKVASRHVFLDHVQKEVFLAAQFALAIKRAREYKKAILIAHPYPITLQFLQKKLSNLPDDIELITVSEYLQETDKFRINPRLAMNSSSIVGDELNLETAPQD
jgi:polysaccharide deacetylase 2 family uncharacterized protein YibQ